MYTKQVLPRDVVWYSSSHVLAFNTADLFMAQDQSRRSRGLHIQRNGQQPPIPRPDDREFSLPPVTPIRHSLGQAPVVVPQAILLTSPVVHTVSPGVSEDIVFTADTAHIQALPTERLEYVCPNRLTKMKNSLMGW